MANDFNPYRAPYAAIADDFIAVEPIRRPTINFVAAAVSLGCSVFLLFIEGICVHMEIDRWSRAGTKFENHPTHLGARELILIPIGCSALGFLFAARSFWGRRDLRGVIWFLAAIGVLVSSFLLPLLFPW